MPAGFFVAGRPMRRRDGGIPCKSAVFRLYYQENIGAHACKSAPSALFFVRRSPDSASLYRSFRFACSASW
jgi:hypothetical protein